MEYHNAILNLDEIVTFEHNKFLYTQFRINNIHVETGGNQSPSPYISIPTVNTIHWIPINKICYKA